MDAGCRMIDGCGIRRSEFPRTPGIVRNREASGSAKTGSGKAGYIEMDFIEGRFRHAGRWKSRGGACGIQDAPGNEKTRTNRVKKVKKSQGN